MNITVIAIAAAFFMYLSTLLDFIILSINDQLSIASFVIGVFYITFGFMASFFIASLLIDIGVI